MPRVELCPGMNRHCLWMGPYEHRGTEFSGQPLPHSAGTEPTRERRKLKERRVTEGRVNLKDREGVRTGLWPDDCP